VYTVRIDIAAPPARVFDVLTDPKMLRLWMHEVAKFQQPENRLKVGDVSRAVVQEFGRKFPVELKLTRHEQDAAVGFDMTTPMWSGQIEYILTEVHSGTRLDMLFQPVTPPGWKRIPVGWLWAVIWPLAQRVHRKRLEALRAVVERREPNRLDVTPSLAL
jgi:uncharacterized protein YndB with AHSA1/START domain